MPSKWADRHTHSQVHLGGPEQVRPEDIAYQHQLLQERNPYAGRAQLSSLVLTDASTPIERTQNRYSSMRAAQSNIQITDKLPPGAGLKPPNGYFYNAHGNLQSLPLHAAVAARSQITPALFGGPADEAGKYIEHKHGTRAHVESRAQESLVDAIVFGRQGNPECRLAQGTAQEAGRRHIEGRPSRISEALYWPGYESRYSEELATVPEAHAQITEDNVQPSISGHRHMQVQPEVIMNEPSRMLSMAPERRLQSVTALKVSPLSLYQLPQGQAVAQVPTIAGQRHNPIGGQDNQLFYDQEARKWVTRDGIPASHDPILKYAPGSGALQHRDVGVAQHNGLRHPKLWMTTSASSYVQPAAPPPLAYVAESGGPQIRMSRNFTSAFPPPAPSTGFVF